MQRILFWTAVSMLIAAGGSGIGTVAGQAPANKRTHHPHPQPPVLVGPPRGVYVIERGGPATPYSAATQAEASFLQALGSLRVDTANAQWINAQTYSKQLENSELAVATYFRRQLINQMYRRLLTPAAPEPRSPGEAIYLQARKGDLSKELNWLFLNVFQQRLASNAAFISALDGAPGNPDLSPHEIQSIWLTDRPETGIRFRADGKDPLKEKPPFLFLSSALNEDRKNFERCRDQAVEQLQKRGALDYDQTASLRAAWESLFSKFCEEFQPRLGKPDGPKPQDYAEAKHFLGKLELQIYRLERRANLPLDDYTFRGQRLTELVDHMAIFGLCFAKPGPGDEGVYRTLFLRMQDLYQRGLKSNQSDTAKKAG
jgi:hypothetical protein